MSADQLLVQAVGGDQDALGLLLRRYGSQTRATLGAKIPPRMRSVLSEDDVMQVTYLNAFLHIGEFEPNGCASFAAWLSRIASNNLRNAIKGLEAAKRPDPRHRIRCLPGGDSSMALFETLVGPDSTPSQKAHRREIRDAMTDAISRLPEAYESVVRFYDLEGRSARETAALMDLSQGAVYMLRARAHERLRETLGSGAGLF